MNFDLLLFFVGSHPAEIAMALYVIGVVLLLDSMRVQSRTIAQLRDHLNEGATAHRELRGEVHELRERCADLLARQQRINTRGPDSNRIDMAVRMLKRGAGDSRMLQDLGLSDSEAKLLVRLHGKPAAPQAALTTPQPVAAQGQSLMNMLKA